MPLRKVVFCLTEDDICQFAFFVHKISMNCNILNQGLLGNQIKKLSYIHCLFPNHQVLFLVLRIQQ